MLGKLFGFGKKEDDMDRSLGYSRVAEFSTYLTQSAFPLFEEKYKELEADAKSLLSEGLGLNKQYEDSIQKWVSQNDESYIANLFAGVSYTRKACEARTAALGKDVSEKRAMLFIEFLETAYDYLQKADQLNPDEPEICARMIRVCMGLGVDEEPASSYFYAAKELDADHLFSHLMMINYLNPKWHGSMEKMHGFADENYKEGDDNLLVTLKLFAITEEWCYYDIMNESAKARELFKNTELKNKVLSLYHKFREPSKGALLVPVARNYFAFLLYQFGEKNLARTEIRKIAGKMTEYPWAYLGILSNKKLQEL